jgi:hypothetical protein
VIVGVGLGGVDGPAGDGGTCVGVDVACGSWMSVGVGVAAGGAMLQAASEATATNSRRLPSWRTEALQSPAW